MERKIRLLSQQQKQRAFEKVFSPWSIVDRSESGFGFDVTHEGVSVSNTCISNDEGCSNSIRRSHRCVFRADAALLLGGQSGCAYGRSRTRLERPLASHN